MASPFDKIQLGLVYWDTNDDTVQEDAKRMVEEGLDELGEFFASMPTDIDDLFPDEED
jgi:hypothetical protein